MGINKYSAYDVVNTLDRKNLANIIKKITGCKISYLENPRNEDDSNELHVENDSLINFGLN